MNNVNKENEKSNYINFHNDSNMSRHSKSNKYSALFTIDTMKMKQIQDTILKKNQQAMQNLNQGKKQDAIKLLQEAECTLLEIFNTGNTNEQINRLIGITLNNLGCYFQKDEKPQVALKYLKKALEIEQIKIYDYSALSGTHLNICAILSSLGKHSEAINHGMSALELVNKAKEEILKEEQIQDNVYNDLNDSTSQLLSQLQTQVIDLAVSLQKSSYNIYTTEIVSYYNLGIEYQYLNQHFKSLQMLKQGKEIALNHFGSNNPLTMKMNESIKKAQQIIRNQMNKKTENMIKRTKSPMNSDQNYIIQRDHSFISTKITTLQSEQNEKGMNDIETEEDEQYKQMKKTSNHNLSTINKDNHNITINIKQQQQNGQEKQRSYSTNIRGQKERIKEYLKLPVLTKSTFDQINHSTTNHNHNTSVSRVRNKIDKYQQQLLYVSPINKINELQSITMPSNDLSNYNNSNITNNLININKTIDNNNNHNNINNNGILPQQQQQDQDLETIFAQIVRKNQNSPQVVDELQKQWSDTCNENIQNKSEDKLLKQIHHNMDERNINLLYQNISSYNTNNLLKKRSLTQNYNMNILEGIKNENKQQNTSSSPIYTPPFKTSPKSTFHNINNNQNSNNNQNNNNNNNNKLRSISSNVRGFQSITKRQYNTIITQDDENNIHIRLNTIQPHKNKDTNKSINNKDNDIKKDIIMNKNNDKDTLNKSTLNINNNNNINNNENKIIEKTINNDSDNKCQNFNIQDRIQKNSRIQYEQNVGQIIDTLKLKESKLQIQERIKQVYSSSTQDESIIHEPIHKIKQNVQQPISILRTGRKIGNKKIQFKSQYTPPLSPTKKNNGSQIKNI